MECEIIVVNYIHHSNVRIKQKTEKNTPTHRFKYGLLSTNINNIF